jgi:hypothetical protein
MGQVIILTMNAIDAEEADGMHIIRNAMHVTAQDAMSLNVDDAEEKVKSNVLIVTEMVAGTVKNAVAAAFVPIATAMEVLHVRHVKERVSAENARGKVKSNVRLVAAKGFVATVKERRRLIALNVKVRDISSPIPNTA